MLSSMRVMLKLILLLVSTLSFSSDNSCKKWFNKSKIKIGKSCILQCSSLITDMNTFQCPNQCDQLCSTCPQRTNLKTLIKPKMFFKKDNRAISTLPFTQEQKNLLESALKRIPDSLIGKNLKGIVKMKKPMNIFTQRDGMSYIDGYIVVYEPSFDSPKNLEKKLVHELSHHFHENQGKKKFKQYKKKVRWSTHSRPGSFLSSDAENSPEEDFAVNFEHYLTNPKKLKSTVPEIHKWFRSNIEPQYKLKECKQ